jgi:SAM-dependent methyltransferase
MRKGNDDAFGQALLAHYKGELEDGQEFYFIERDDNYLDVDNIGTYFRDKWAWSDVERDAFDRHVRRSGASKVLDLGCGAGRHALCVQEMGVMVTAIDSSPGAVEVSRARGVKDVQQVAVEDLLREYSFGSFDQVLMLGHNLGLLGGSRKAQHILNIFDRITTSDAKIIATTQDPTKTTNPFHRAYHERNRRSGKLPGQVKMRVRFKNLISGWFEYLFVSVEELEVLLKSSHWRIEDLFLEPDQASYAVVITKKSHRP